MKTIKKATLNVKAGVKAGGLQGQPGQNHSRNALKVKAGIKAGTAIQLANHNCRLLALS